MPVAPAAVFPMSMASPLVKLTVPAVWLTVPVAPAAEPTLKRCPAIGRLPCTLSTAEVAAKLPTVTAAPTLATRLPEKVRVPAETVVAPV